MSSNKRDPVDEAPASRKRSAPLEDAEEARRLKEASLILIESRENLIKSSRRCEAKFKAFVENRSEIDHRIRQLLIIDKFDLVRMQTDQECLNISLDLFKKKVNEIVERSNLFSSKRQEDIIKLRQSKDGTELMRKIRDGYVKAFPEHDETMKLMETCETISWRIRQSLMAYSTVPIIREQYVKMYLTSQNQILVATNRLKTSLKVAKKAIRRHIEAQEAGV